MSVSDSSQKLRKTVAVSLFAAISYALMLVVKFPVAFLTMDVKDVVITLCGLYFGPASAFFISILIPFLEMITVSSTGLYGFVMNALGSVAFSVTAALFYKYKKNLLGAILGIFSGAFCMIAVMLLLNLVVTPFYMGCTAKDVAGMIPTLLLPFNCVKVALNGGLVFLLYKPISEILRKAKFLPASAKPFRFDKTTLLISFVSLLVIGASVTVLFLVLNGSVDIGL